MRCGLAEEAEGKDLGHGGAFSAGARNEAAAPRVEGSQGFTRQTADPLKTPLSVFPTYKKLT